MLRGAWRKPDAEYLGHNAREEARRRRIAELEAVLRDDRRIDRKTGAGRKSDRDTIRPNCQGTCRRAQRCALQRAAHELESAESASADARQLLDEIDQLLSKAVEAEHDTRDTRDAMRGSRSHAVEGNERTREVGLLLADVRVKAAALWPAWDSLQGAAIRIRKCN